MFKDRAVQVSMVRQGSSQTESDSESQWTPANVSALIQDQINTILITGAMVYVVKTVADTTRDVVIKKTKQR